MSLEGSCRELRREHFRNKNDALSLWGRTTWLRTVEFDLQPLKPGLNSTWMRAQDRSKWRQLAERRLCSRKGAPPDVDDGSDDDDKKVKVVDLYSASS